MLRGTISDVSLLEVFRLLGGAGKSGRLYVRAPSCSGWIVFEDGAIAGAVSDVEPAAKEAALWLLALDEGEFSWNADDVDDDASPGPRWHHEDLIREAHERRRVLAVVNETVRSLEAVARLAPVPPVGSDITVSPEQWRVLALVDGRRTVREIAAQSNHGTFETMKLLHGLLTGGLIEMDGVPAESHPAPPGRTDRDEKEPRGADEHAAEVVSAPPPPPPNPPPPPPPLPRPSVAPSPPSWKRSVTPIPEEWFEDPVLDDEPIASED